LAKINWDEYKEYKQYNSKENNFEILIDFIKSYYNMTNAYDIFAILNEDDTAKMMLDKREIKDAEGLENFMLKL
jgi:5'-deoxynucleotidase YfbR-like HD superfamily hydrolase